MPAITRILLLRIECDKPGCGDNIKVPDPEMREYDPRFDALIKRARWTVWVGRGRRYYCPDHGPSANTKMRQVTR